MLGLRLHATLKAAPAAARKEGPGASSFSSLVPIENEPVWLLAPAATNPEDLQLMVMLYPAPASSPVGMSHANKPVFGSLFDIATAATPFCEYEISTKLHAGARHAT